MVGMGTGQEMEEGEEGLHLGSQREKAGKRPTPCSGGRAPILGRKRKMRKMKDRPESGPGGGRMQGWASEWEQIPGRWLPPPWKVSSGFPGPHSDCQGRRGAGLPAAI